MKKSILKIKDTPEKDDVLIYAISSVESAFQLCLVLNKTLKINLSLGRVIEQSKNDIAFQFPIYHFEDEEGIEKYTLFVNRNNSRYLLPALKKIDFVLLIQSEGSFTAIENQLNALRSSPLFTALHKLDHKIFIALQKYLE